MEHRTEDLPEPRYLNSEPEEWWLEQARKARDTLATMGMVMMECLPGEEHEESCGEPVWEHYAMYMALIKARADVGLRVCLHESTGTTTEHYASVIYQEQRDRMLDEVAPPKGGWCALKD